MLTRSSLSTVLIAVVLTFVTLSCCAHDWVRSTLPSFTDPGPDSVIVDTTGVAHIYNSSSNWHCWGNPDQGWQVEDITYRDVICLDITTEENETHAAYVCFNGNVYYQWRTPNSDWQVELIESFRPESIERVEIEKSPDGNLWLAVLYNDMFYLYEHTDEGWTDHVIETMPAQFKDQSLWRLEIDWENQLQLVRQISPIGFYHITGTPGNWSNAIINNIEELPGDTREFEMTGMEMRKNNTPVIHVRGSASVSGKTEYFAAAIFNNEDDWEAGETMSDYYGQTAYDHARDRIHCVEVQGIDDSRYWSVALSDDSRDSYTPLVMPVFESVCCMTIGKLDLPHVVEWDGGRLVYHCPPADIYCHVNMTFHDANVTIGNRSVNWKWNRPARMGFLMEIAGQYYWSPNWTNSPYLKTMNYDTGESVQNYLDVPVFNGDYGIDVTFYTALLHPVDDVFLNGACWDMLTVIY